jgi:hypothetical protein
MEFPSFRDAAELQTKQRPHKGRGNGIPLVPKLWLGNGLMGIEAGASAQLCSQAGAWEQEEQEP